MTRLEPWRYAAIAAVVIVFALWITWTASHEGGGADETRTSQSSTVWFTACQDASNYMRDLKQTGATVLPRQAVDTLVSRAQSDPGFGKLSAADHDATLAGIRAGVGETC